MIDWQTFTVLVVVMWLGVSLFVIVDPTMRWRDRLTVIAICGIVTFAVILT